jgi:glycosyltransferase involved in cell wall biosynthesis
MDRELEICLITASYWPAWGGAEGQCRLLARELCRRGHRVVVLTRGREDAPGEELADGVIVRRIPTRGAGHLRSLVWTVVAALWLRRHGRGMDVLQCYQLLSPAHVGVLGRPRRERQPIVVRPACSGVYGDVAEVRRLPLTRVRQRLLRTVDVFVTLTGVIEAELAAFGLGAVPCRRIPNAVDLDTFRPATTAERRELRVRLGLPQDRVLCTFMGRLAPQKNPEALLEAWSVGISPDTHLALVGDGPLRTRLQARIEADGCGDRVTLVGPTGDSAAYLRASDLFVLPSRAEGMSNALLEAMACGIPVVATDVAGNREVVGEDGTAGRLVPAEDPAALAEAVATLVASPTLRREISAAGRARILDRFDIQRVAAQYLSLYEELQERP